MITELVEFLRARLDEDEEVAQAATSGPWWWGVAPPGIKADSILHGTHPVDPRGSTVLMTTKNRDVSRYDADHISRWDPPRVLAEVAAKRAILDEYDRLVGMNQQAAEVRWPRAAATTSTMIGPMEIVVQLLAQPYSGTSGFREEWRLGT